MPDREKVIKGLECHITNGDCRECPYLNDELCGTQILKDARELLKGQEPVAPVLVPTGYGAGIVCNCGACGTELFALNGTNVKGVSSVVRFCRMCGKAVKWNEAN